MALIPMPPGCRSCRYFVSEKGAAPDGVCCNDESPACFEPVTWTDACRGYDARQFDGRYLMERECTRCEHANLYEAGYNMTLSCARCGDWEDDE